MLEREWSLANTPAPRQRVGRLRLDTAEAMGALDAAERGIALDLLNEGVWRLALEAEAKLGVREAVADRYEALRNLLDERLGLKPDHQTRNLHRETALASLKGKHTELKRSIRSVKLLPLPVGRS